MKLLQLLFGSSQLLTELLHALVREGLEGPGWRLWLVCPGLIPLPYCLLQGILYLVLTY